jgi:hypothetical protein
VPRLAFVDLVAASASSALIATSPSHRITGAVIVSPGISCVPKRQATRGIFKDQFRRLRRGIDLPQDFSQHLGEDPASVPAQQRCTHPVAQLYLVIDVEVSDSRSVG